MKISLESLCVLVFVCVVTVLSAPAKKNVGSVQKPSSSSSSSIQQQEKELEKLARLAAQRLSQSIGVQKQKSFHYSNLNGKENSESQTEEKVVNPDTGDLVSDIKQDTKQDGDVITETKIKIPSEHIEKSFLETQPENLGRVPLEKEDYSEAFQFTPVEVAKYLYQTGNFQELNQALSDLVNASIMTEKQAIEYKDNVRSVYNKLVQTSMLSDSNEVPLYNTGYESPDNMLPTEVLPAYNYYNELLPYGSADTQNMLPEVDEGNGISDLVNTLMDEWLTRTVLTGDRDAETMLSEIWDSVSQDDNPDDLGQMRDILVDIFTSEIIEGLTSDVQGELPYYADLLTNETEDQQMKGADTNESTEEKQNGEDNKTENSKEETEDIDVNKAELKPEEDLKHLKM
ncbi:uncharacterized protein LOC127722040 [Mytilus californianus]|uniref:uncharacterized protein LOC127722040 n=1 Tax=Mytilus californianus TaxID=6549 RepID=UPI0022484D98|nr:uncharacterized protein LOC127722040 [Mytilus californianus]